MNMEKFKEKLTYRQKDVYEFIRDRLFDTGKPPTIREIGRELGISSTNGVRTHLNALIKKGYIKKTELIHRGIELVSEMTREVSRVPLVGSVPAGNPIDAIENIESEFALDLSFLPKGETFSLKVIGDSMIDAGIFDGDIVIVQKQATARTGEIIVAIIDGEATVKRYFPESNSIRLQPENDQFEPIIVTKGSGEFKIAGKVVGLLRKF